MQRKTAIILGASRGIGAATAMNLASRGLRTILVARNQSNLTIRRDSLPGEGHETIAADLSRPQSAAVILDHCSRIGLPDIVVWNHYVRSELKKLEKVSSAGWAQALQENCRVILELYPAFADHQRIQGFGRWILVSSAVAQLGGPGQGIYASVKSAQEALIRTIAVEQGNKGITANIIRAGFIDTPGIRENYDQETIQRLSSMNLAGRAGKPEDVAAAVGFLVSEEASFVNAAILPVDGGLSSGWFLNPPAP